MNKEEYIAEYVSKGNPLFSVTDIATMRDGGTKMLYCRFSKKSPFYIHKDNWTLHSEYPTTDENIVKDRTTKVYILDGIKRYKKDCEFNLMMVNNIIEKIKL